MTRSKGPRLEEVVRAYFARQGFFALRGVDLRFEGDKVTDIDVWLYGRQSASIRTRTIVDVKDKRSPKAFERILWTRGMQLALGCDRAIVATTYSSTKAKRFAREQGVALLHKDFLERLRGQIDTSNRISGEQFTESINTYRDHKLDGDWLRQIADVKSALIGLAGYPAFNKAMSAFRFFAERAMTRSQHKEQALRGVYITAAVACVALDSALEQSLYESVKDRYQAIADGVTYGDSGDFRTRNSIRTVLDIVSSGMENGQVVARQAEEVLNGLFASIRADIIAEFFSREHNASMLFSVAKELDDCAYTTDVKAMKELSIAAKSTLGVFCDFVQIKRNVLWFGKSNIDVTVSMGEGSEAQSGIVDESEEVEPSDNQASLL